MIILLLILIFRSAILTAILNISICQRMPLRLASLKFEFNLFKFKTLPHNTSSFNKYCFSMATRLIVSNRNGCSSVFSQICIAYFAYSQHHRLWLCVCVPFCINVSSRRGTKILGGNQKYRIEHFQSTCASFVLLLLDLYLYFQGHRFGIFIVLLWDRVDITIAIR